MRIGPHQLENNLIVAPMAGVTDRPFRALCRRLGAGLAVSEMVTADASLYGTRKTVRRLDHDGEEGPVSVQIVGTEPLRMAEAARINVAHGAQIVDINMGCPAKKVCKVAAGSALMRDEPLVARILSSVVNAVDVPVTLKIRTGWDLGSRNAPRIAQLAEESGIAALAVHGRTRACGYSGEAEYETIRRVVHQASIPVVANGDIDSPEKAAEVLALTGADALMIGRAAQVRPWIFREINYFLQNNTKLPAPDAKEVNNLLFKHLKNLYDFYGETAGVRIARKHIGWYCKHYYASPVEHVSDTATKVDSFRKSINKVESADLQLEQVAAFFTSTGRLLAA